MAFASAYIHSPLFFFFCFHPTYPCRMDPIVIRSDDEVAPFSQKHGLDSISDLDLPQDFQLSKKRRITPTPAPPVPTTAPHPAFSSIPIPKSVANKFRLQAKSFLVTFPKCSLSVDQVLERCKKFKNLEWAIVAQEAHQDGDPHLHLVLHLSQKTEFKGKKGLELFDGLASQHGNYKSIKSSRQDLLRSVEYVMKDGNFKSHGIDPKDLVNRLKNSKEGNSGVWSKATSQVLAGTTIAELNAWNPGFVALNLRKLQEYRLFVENEKKQKEEAPKTLLIRVGMDVPTSAGIALLTWMNENLTLGKTLNRPPRSKQLWLWGAPGIGKTRMIAHLRTYLRIYVVNNDEDWYDHWSDELFDLAVFDEFKGQKTIQFMNGFLDGQVMNLKQKSRGSYIKRFNVACIILSNFPPQQCYHKAFEKNASQLAPLLDRLTVIQWDSPTIDLEYIAEDRCSDYEKEESAAGNWREYVNFLASDAPPGSPTLD